MKKVAFVICLLLVSTSAFAAPKAFVPNQGDETISVIDIAGGNVEATLNATSNPLGIAQTADGSTIYVTNENAGSVAVVDTATNSITGTILLPTGRPAGISLSPDESTLLVADPIFDMLHAVDIASASVNGSLGLDGAAQVQYSADGTKAWVALANTGDIEVVDTASLTISTTIASVGTNPGGLLLDGANDRLYVATQGNLVIIDTTTDSVADTVGLGASGHNASGIALDTSTGLLYIGNSDTGEVKVIDTATDMLADTFTPGGEPRGLALTPDNGSLFLLDRANDQALVLDPATGTVNDTIAVGPEPQARGDFIVDAPLAPIPARQVPTMSPIGLLIAALLMLIAGAWVARHRNPRQSK